jgi:hypothetical protein
MTDSIDHRNRCRFLWEEVTPLVERPAAGDPEAPVLVGSRGEPKEGLAAGGVKRRGAQLVEDQHVDAEYGINEAAV